MKRPTRSFLALEKQLKATREAWAQRVPPTASVTLRGKTLRPAEVAQHLEALLQTFEEIRRAQAALSLRRQQRNAQILATKALLRDLKAWLRLSLAPSGGRDDERGGS